MRLTPEITLTILGATAAAAVLARVVFLKTRKKTDPEVLRRALIDAQGRIIEGVVTDHGDETVYYRWRWRGIDYESSQDIRALADRVPAADRMIGPVSVKFLLRVPSNSIVISENWSGFTPAKPAGVEPDAG